MSPLYLGGDPCRHLLNRFCRPLIWQRAKHVLMSRRHEEGFRLWQHTVQFDVTKLGAFAPRQVTRRNWRCREQAAEGRNLRHTFTLLAADDVQLVGTGSVAGG